MLGRIYYYNGELCHPEIDEYHFIEFIDYFTSEKDLNKKLQKFYKNRGLEVLYDRWIHTADDVKDIDFGSWTKFIRVIYDER